MASLGDLDAYPMGKRRKTSQFFRATQTMRPLTLADLGLHVGCRDTVASFGVHWEEPSPARQQWVTSVRAGGKGGDLDPGSRPAAPSMAG